MSATETGTASERRYRSLLEARGYQVSPPPKKVCWIPTATGRRPVVSDSDFFGIFDIISYNSEHWRLTQVTGWDGGNRQKRMAKIIKHIRFHPLPQRTICEVAAWRGGRRRLDRAYTREKRYIPHQLFYVYTLGLNSEHDYEFFETARAYKNGKIQYLQDIRDGEIFGSV